MKLGQRKHTKEITVRWESGKVAHYTVKVEFRKMPVRRLRELAFRQVLIIAQTGIRGGYRSMLYEDIQNGSVTITNTN